MRKRKFKSKPTNSRPRRAPTPTLQQFDFEPMMPFLRERLDEDHPVFRAAVENDLAAFMAALREVGDGQLNHDIAGELERISRPLVPSS
ncbi:MAG: hypothetical protein R3322_03145 [Kiloniellales bacterium]|jgi:hypothetical protein|nr:hypothetical protein [Kiloniellales bacterium]